MKIKIDPFANLTNLELCFLAYGLDNPTAHRCAEFVFSPSRIQSLFNAPVYSQRLFKSKNDKVARIVDLTLVLTEQLQDAQKRVTDKEHEIELVSNMLLDFREENE